MFEIPDGLWNRIFPLLVSEPKRKKKRQVVQEWMIKGNECYLLITRPGCSGKTLPRSLGASSKYMTGSDGDRWRIQTYVD